MTELRPLAGSILLMATVALASLPGCATTPAAVQGQGEPVPLDSTDPRYARYLDRVRSMIKEKWVYPCVKDEATGICEYKSVKLVVVFALLENGHVPWVRVQETSGYGIYDDYAANAIRLASPFPPVPQALMATGKPGSAEVRLEAAFAYPRTTR